MNNLNDWVIFYAHARCADEIFKANKIILSTLQGNDWPSGYVDAVHEKETLWLSL